MSNLYFLKSLFSPFKPLKLKWYIGKVAIGTPYFLPRRWVNFTKLDAENAAKEAVDNRKKLNRTFEEWCEYFSLHQKAVPKKIGFDFVGLGWKTKFGDYRFEWSPVISFVFFKWQIAVTFLAPEEDHYWESWLYYEYNTDKTKSKQERVNQCRKEAPQIWTRHIRDKGSETIDYYDLILKKKYKTKQ
jgi:hypothetical protein